MKLRTYLFFGTIISMMVMNLPINGQENIKLDEKTYTSPEDSADKLLAKKLIAAKDDAERALLLKRDGSLISANVVRAITEEAEHLDGKTPIPELERICKLAIAFGEQIRDKREIARSLQLLGHFQRDATESMASYQRGLALSEEVGDEEMAAKFLIGLGSREQDQAKQLDYFQRSLRLAEKIGDKKIASAALYNIGNNYIRRGDYINAREFLSRSLQIREEINDLVAISSTLNSIAIMNTILGDLTSAREYFQKSLEISQSIGKKDRIGINLYNLGITYYLMGDYSRAMELYMKSLSLFEEIGADGGIEGVSTNIANLYIAQGDFGLARTYLDRASRIHDKTGKDIPQYALGSYANSYKVEGKFDTAISYYQKLLSLKEKIGNKDSIAETLVDIGKCYLLVPDAVKAAENFEQARILSDASGNQALMFQALIGISQTQLIRNDFHSALATANVARTHNEQLMGRREYWELYTTLGRAFRGLGDEKQARANFERSVEVVESLRNNVAGNSSELDGFFKDKLSSYHFLVDSLIEERSYDLAFRYMELAKAKALLETLGNGKIKIEISMTPKETAEEQILKNELVSYSSQIEKEKKQTVRNQPKLVDLQNRLAMKRLQFEDFQNRIYVAHPELRAQRGNMEPISVEETGSLVQDQKSAVAEFIVAEDKTFLFVITKDSAKKVSLKVFAIDVKDEELAKRVEAYRSKLASGDLDFQKESRELYDLLLRPAAGQLAGKTNLIIVPDGPLWDMPFQALQNEKNRYLAEQASISYAPSLTALKEMAKRAKTRKPDAGMELVAFGNPMVGKETGERVRRVFMGEKLEPIPEAERLVNTLKQMYGPARARVYTGADAREGTAKAESPKFRIVQFATHGILNNVSPMYSHLVLAQNDKDQNEDGLLEAWEMKDLDLKADMVILSACDTARGKVSSGEGMIGMSWALFIAGTPTTVASQWKVESSSTTELMLEFHRQLLSGKKISKAEALRQAELKLMKIPKYKHPSYWAGFVLVGDGS